MYRYEVQKILGKGSFAQVVRCKDHMLSTNDREVIVAVKITRNTELDHKFAVSEGNLLRYIMDKDPNDDHNIVRLLDEF
jgi:dual specificity tyrosine-phosphorylation-regulated kinase 2/3/4